VEGARALDRGRGPVGGELQQVGVGRDEQARRQRADVQHTDHVALHEQRDAEQRADALLAQDRVQDVGVVDVLDRDRAPLGRDPAREPAADRDPHALLDLLLDALGGGGHERVAALVDQQEGGGVGVQDLGDPLQQLVEQRVQRQIGEADVGDPLEGLEFSELVVRHVGENYGEKTSPMWDFTGSPAP
jgi:hypothetical protein